MMDMLVPRIPKYQFPVQKSSQIHPKKPILRGKQRCAIRAEGSARTEKNYYDTLGVSIDSNPQEIKEFDRKLQKKHHLDIAGQKGHEHTLKLNKAYEVLMKEDMRRKYDASIGQMRNGFGRNSSVMGCSSWKGPLRPQALFVDENACIGCRECVHLASNTFAMDEGEGSARVKVQFGDDDTQIEVSVEACPVNCIHWVDREDLEVLEFVSQPTEKEGYGVFGQGWNKPANVFMAAKAFKKQMERRAEDHGSRAAFDDETPLKLRLEPRLV